VPQVRDAHPLRVGPRPRGLASRIDTNGPADYSPLLPWNRRQVSLFLGTDSMPRAMLRALWLFCLPCVGGCILPYCAYPRLDYTPSAKLDAPPGEVRAFRVDITRPTADMSVFVGPVYERLAE